MDNLGQVVEQTLRRYVRPGCRLAGIETMPMREDENGYSGARLRRHVVMFRSPKDEMETTTLVTKEAPLIERRVLDRLSVQEHCVPFSHALDLTTDMSALVCQQDLRAVSSQPLPTTDIKRQAARRLARIHHANLGRVTELGWLPRANRAYFEDVILADYRNQLARARERPTFEARYGDLVRQMEEAVEPFLTAMDALWADGDSLTLIHADMMDTHVLVHEGRPYFIDWGQARYGSFYLDLPNYFTPDNVLFYREALAELGLHIPEKEFAHRYSAAGRYSGFKYIGFLLYLWAGGQRDSLQGSLLELLLHGAVRPSLG